MNAPVEAGEISTETSPAREFLTWGYGPAGEVGGTPDESHGQGEAAATGRARRTP